MPRGDAAKTRDWQARGAKKYADKQRNDAQVRATARSESRARAKIVQAAKRDTPVRQARRRNDAPWRHEVMAAYGPACVSCGDTAHVQADHMKPRSQGGPSVRPNGLPLCGEFSRNTPGGCHPAKTAGRIVIDPAWLADEQIAWLAEVGWVWWDEDGEPQGRGHKHFGRMRRPTTERVEADGEEGRAGG